MKIKKKRILVTKLQTKQYKKITKLQIKEAFTTLIDCLQNGFDIIYCDEVTFTVKTHPKTAWSLPREHFEIDYK